MGLLATPTTPTTAASAAPCEALPFSPGQAAQLAAQVLQRIGPHRLALAPEHCEADRPVERGQIARLQPPCLAFLETQPHHADPLRSEEHTSELQSRLHLVCRLLLE